MDHRDIHSKRNPHGPYKLRARPHEVSPHDHIEGFSTQKNIDKWSERATSNSGPHIAPGTWKKI